jgi:hypothetical protein
MCPDNDVFSVVCCYSCGMVLRPQALNEHIEKKHKGNNLLMDDLSDKVEEKSEKIDEPKAKRQKVDHNRNIESYPLGYPPELVIEQPPQFQLQKSQSFYQIPQQVHEPQSLQYSQSFTMPKPPKRRIAHQTKPEPLKIKMKLKRAEQGQWSVV